MKATGAPIFGIDVQVPEMVCARVQHAPLSGAKPTLANEREVLALPGVLQVVLTSSGLAVIATKYWQAKAAGEALQVRWDEPAGERFSSARHLQQCIQQMSVSLQAVTSDLSWCHPTRFPCDEVGLAFQEALAHFEVEGPDGDASCFAPFIWHNLAFDPLQSVTICAIEFEIAEMGYFQAVPDVVAVAADRMWRRASSWASSCRWRRRLPPQLPCASRTPYCPRNPGSRLER